VSDTADRFLSEMAIGGGEYVGGLDLMGFGQALGSLALRTSFSAVPKRAMELGAEWTRIALNRSQVRPTPRDRRFTNRAWDENFFFSRLGRSYLAWVDSLMGLLDDADLDWRTEERARFVLNNVVAAVAPTNFLLLNPEACERAFETGGKSILRSVRNIGRDIRYNRGRPRANDRDAFEVGRNLAMTPGAVVFQNDVCELLQFAATTDTVRENPVVVVPPQINKYYVMDLSPGRSFVEHAVQRGFQTFAVSWRNPKRSHRHWDLDTYVTSVTEALEAAAEITGSDAVGVVGVCAGGLTIGSVLGHLAATGGELIRTATFAVTQMDYSVPSTIGMFSTPRVVQNATRTSSAAGVLDGVILETMFAALRPNDLIWNYWVKNNLLGEDPSAFDVLAWNADSTALPAALHAQFLDIYLHNRLARAELTVRGLPVDLSKVKCETMVVGGRTDHLVPWRACYANCGLFGGASEFVLSSSGHIQCLVNPPGSKKMTITTGPAPDISPDDWLAQASEEPGVWWERWAEWQAARAGGLRSAPTSLGSRTHPAGKPAPGEYVKNA
jgi:polyhydroxyalkanoate synthase subunit PhaC